MGIADKVPSNARIAVVGLTLPIFTLFGLALLGCVSTSPGIPSLYLFLLQVDEITLRVGYYAICALDAAGNSTLGSRPSGNSSSSEDDNLCVATVGADAKELSTKLLANGTSTDSDDIVPVLDLALNLQSKILIPLILMATILLLFGAVLFTLTKVMQMKLKDPASWQGTMKKVKLLKPITLSLIWITALIAFGAAVGSSMAISALNFIIPVLATNINVTGGKMVQALQYIAFLFCALFGIAATLLLGDPLEKQSPEGGERGDFNLDEKELGYDPSMMDGQQRLPEEMPEGMDPEEWAQLQQQQQEQDMMQQQMMQQQALPDEMPEGMDPEEWAQLQQQQQQQQEQQMMMQQQAYAEGAEYPQDQIPGEQYPDGQQPYMEGAEYEDPAYAQQQQQQQQQPPYPQ